MEHICFNPSCVQKNPLKNVSCQYCETTLYPKLKNRYQIERVLGQGAFGITYLAKDEENNNSYCVLKRIFTLKHSLKEAEQIFNLETNQLRQLGHHDQIPTLLDQFRDQDFFYLVQQYIEGDNLLIELKKEGKFSEKKIIALLLSLLPVLKFIHSQGVIHRDIKPDNIVRRRSDGVLVLIDFGISKNISLVTHKESRPQNIEVPPGADFAQSISSIAGSHGFSPMEQLQYGRVYPASDLYSLGVTCIRLMTGCFLQEDGSDRLFNIKAGKWLYKDYQFISQELCEILDKMIQPFVEYRFKSAQEILDLLQSPTPTQLPSNLSSFSFQIATLTKDDQGQVHTEYTQGSAQQYIEHLGNEITLEMVYIPSGEFLMASNDKIHVKPFFMAKYPLTIKQWEIVMGYQNAYFPADWNHPMETISWFDIQEYLKKLNQIIANQGKKYRYRLPSEIEWEYACKAGTITKYHFGDLIIPEVANYNYQNGQTTPVGYYQLANAFGLYDMHGLIWEICQNKWRPDEDAIVLRGGSWCNNDKYCSSEYRYRMNPDEAYPITGCRLVLS